MYRIITGLALLLYPCIAGGQIGIITTVAGNGMNADMGDNGIAINASVTFISFGAWDNIGNYYFSERGRNKIRKISSNGIISTIAGNGVSGFGGYDSLATLAMLNNPVGIAFDNNQSLIIADLNNNRIRKINLMSGIITTIAGTGIAGYAGDSGLAINAVLNGPTGLCTDPSGNIYFGDRTNMIVRKIDVSGIITTYAGTYNVGGYSGDGGPANSCELSSIEGLCSDLLGNIFICNGDKVRMVNAITGTISTVAGNGISGFNGDSILAQTSELFHPYAVAVDNDENVYIADTYNHRIRKVDTSGIIYTISGNGNPDFSGDNGNASSAELNLPEGVTFDSCGNLYISDLGNFRIRKITFDTACGVDTTTSVNYFVNSNGNISIHPNPVSEVLYIDNIQTAAGYTLLNIMGTCVKKGTLKQGNNEISVEGMAAGMFVLWFDELTMTSGTTSKRYKVVKQ